MVRVRSLAAAIACTLVTAADALAQGAPPPTRPERDVMITYRHPGALPAGMPELQTRILISAATGRQRSENASAVRIVDRPAGRRYTFVADGRDAAGRFVTEQATDDEMDLHEAASDPDFQVSRVGEARFANIACTLWRIRDQQAPSDEMTTYCVSADGLMQEMRGSGMTSRMEAVRVEYGPLDAALFAPPRAGRSDAREPPLVR